jgi:DNA-binding MarR family transcriptional regulator
MVKPHTNRRASISQPGDGELADLGELSTAWNTSGPEYLTLRIGFVAKLIERHSARVLAQKFGLTLAEWRVLAQLARLGPMTVRGLADRSWVDRAEVSRSAASLIERGCVAQAANPADRRSPYFFPTVEGRRLYRKVKATRDSFQRLLASQIGEQEMQSFVAVLYRLTRCLVGHRERAPRRASARKGHRPRRRAP